MPLSNILMISAFLHGSRRMRFLAAVNRIVGHVGSSSSRGSSSSDTSPLSSASQTGFSLVSNWRFGLLHWRVSLYEGPLPVPIDPLLPVYGRALGLFHSWQNFYIICLASFMYGIGVKWLLSDATTHASPIEFVLENKRVLPAPVSMRLTPHDTNARIFSSSVVGDVTISPGIIVLKDVVYVPDLEHLFLSLFTLPD
ncbi:hypothetical protein Cgig2_015816 [Carnegiea gigantea]|uniref:Uncharacterized protein n=1 Tax=Carnegiea gigantea TaxID=171969 RepID=A0A9Q1KI26_9CARY|nr:hypothetical protein Cgig2_015816 [Carnegiea gigantea]